VAYRERWRDPRGAHSGLEFWNPMISNWTDGADVFPMEMSNRLGWGLRVYDPNGSGYGTSWTPSVPVDVRRTLEPEGEVGQGGRDRPDFAMEYLHRETKIWVPGDAIDVDQDTGRWEAYGSQMTEREEQRIPYRRRFVPTDFDKQSPAYGFTPEDHAFNGMIRTVWLQDVYDQPSYLQGGYQMLGEDGQWHTLEEIYKLHPEIPDSTDVELIAGDLHFPEIDLATELTVRRTPMDY